MRSLSDGEIQALENLGRKKGGETVGWISIADARALTELGLARRSANGWVLTPAGAEQLALERSSPPRTPAHEGNADNDEEAAGHEPG
jgi:hypothetical protein